jgi:hypothetical protein
MKSGRSEHLILVDGWAVIRGITAGQPQAIDGRPR